MTITLYEYGPTRSARVRWTLLELDIPFESREGRELIRSEELSKLHPQGKLPAIVDDGRPLFESAAICTWLADSHADKGMIAAAGTWDRALHDQWTAFALTEIEAHLWSSGRNTFVYPEEKRIPAIFDQNNYELKRAMPVLDTHLGEHEFLIAGKFSVTDIIVGYATNWARMAGALSGFDNVAAYNARLLERPLCPYNKG